MLRSSRWMLLAAFALVLGCSDDGDGGDDTVSLAGTYDIAEFAVGIGGGALTPCVQSAPGTAVLTDDEYTFTLSVPAEGCPLPVPAVDEGFYTATGTASSGSFEQESTTSDTQAVGTYTWNASTGELILDTTIQGIFRVRVTLVED